MNAPVEPDWSAANQLLLVAEFARLCALLGDGELPSAQAELGLVHAQTRETAGIDMLAQRFQLSRFERDLLLLAAGVEMDSHLARLCARAQGQSGCPWATFGLALALLPDPHWSALAPAEPLRRWQLILVDEAAGLSSSRLRVDERILHFLAGCNSLDQRLWPLLQQVPAAGLMCRAHRAISETAIEQLRSGGPRPATIVLHGDDSSGQQDIAAEIARHQGIALFRLNASDIASTAPEQAELAMLWQREAILQGCALLIVQQDADCTVLARFVERLDCLVIVSSRMPCPIEADAYRVDRADEPEQRRLWGEAAGDGADSLAPILDMLAGQYRLGARRIADIAARLHDAVDVAALHRACRIGAPAMSELAQCIEARATWEMLVLPEAQRLIMQQIAVHARHRLRVQHDWGFAGRSAQGLGIASLFWGDSGTGKTLAAEVLAGVLGRSLYRVDLSAVVSKYIGETEKNLCRVFDCAEELGAILLFDEADALFGKRSEVKDSHDRYANIEVSYLLQRMEAYRGLAILTTNHKAALDAAFARRLRFVVHFPFPDEAQRRELWRCVFPAATPLGELDYDKLARLTVSGGSIRNIALSAAFLAAEEDAPLSMKHLLHAAHFEAAKQERTFAEAETRGWQ